MAKEVRGGNFTDNARPRIRTDGVLEGETCSRCGPLGLFRVLGFRANLREGELLFAVAPLLLAAAGGGRGREHAAVVPAAGGPGGRGAGRGRHAARARVVVPAAAHHALRGAVVAACRDGAETNKTHKSAHAV
eukprot:1180176-Prorocentrum_minimum.AAC.2